MNQRSLHLLLLLAIGGASVLFWTHLRDRRQLQDEASVRKRSELTELQAALEEGASGTEQLRHAINSKAAALDERLKLLMKAQAASREASLSGSPLHTSEAELPYRWDDNAKTVRLGKRFFASLGLDPLIETTAGPYGLKAVTARLLSLKPEEIEDTQAAIDHLVEQQHAIEQARLQITDQPYEAGNSWILDQQPDLIMTFHLPAFPEEGTRIKREFVNDLTRAMGAARTELFLSIADSQLQSDFGNLGKKARHITFWERLAPDGMLSLSLLDATDGGHSMNTSVTVQPEKLDQTRIMAPIPARWRHLVAGRYRLGQSLEQSRRN